MTDPISDMLTRIRNAYLARQQEVSLPHSQLKETLATKLASLRYLGSVTTQTKSKTKTLHIQLQYKNKLPVITNLKRISKPGRRVYKKHSQISSTLSGHGATLISTNQGILTDKEARQKGLGGEIICQVW